MTFGLLHLQYAVPFIRAYTIVKIIAFVHVKVSDFHNCVCSGKGYNIVIKTSEFFVHSDVFFALDLKYIPKLIYSPSFRIKVYAGWYDVR